MLWGLESAAVQNDQMEILEEPFIIYRIVRPEALRAPLV